MHNYGCLRVFVDGTLGSTSFVGTHVASNLRGIFCTLRNRGRAFQVFGLVRNHLKAGIQLSNISKIFSPIL